ncbi:MAG: DUF5050 domain-containing protein [Chloroflexota bacterium]|nr:MAG: DUF5050 domain-containing protein [Chloroflexota bacterium]
MTFIGTGRHRSWFTAFAVTATAMALVLATAGVAGAAPTPKPEQTVNFTGATYEVVEGVDSACVWVVRSVTKGKAPVVTVTTSDGTASAGVDYTPVSTTVAFGRGASQGSACVPILVDRVLDEPDETVNVTLSTTSRGWTAGAQSTATLTIHEMVPPSAPTDLTADLVSGTVDVAYVYLTWAAPSVGTVDHYVVLSSTSPSGPHTELGTTTAMAFDVTPAPTVGTYYLVEAINPEGASSDSNQAFAEGFIPGSGLYWASFSDGKIMAANPDGTGAHTLVTGQDSPFGVAVDGSHLYWANIGADTIMRANLDGSNVTALVSGQSHPYGVAVDATHLYWTNLQGQTIMRANLDGSNVTTLVDGTGQLQPATIAVDGSHIYWGDIVGDGRIMRANLDGTGMTTLVSGQTYPFAIAVYGDHLYWANTGANEGATGAIMRANLDGSGVTTLASSQPHPDGLAVDGSHLYWANANNGTIVRANMDGSSVTALVTEQNLPAGVAVAP